MNTIQFNKNTEEQKASPFTGKTVKQYWEQNPKNITKDIEFLQWFDNHDSKEAYWASGYIDLSQRILNKSVLKEIQNTYDKSCLEIGYGGGRILSAANSMFRHVYGVDVHDCKERVARLSPNKVELNYLCNPCNIDDVVKDNSLDLVYSFIVFQHFDNIETFQYYVDLIKRKLKIGGVFNIFYGVNRYDNEEYYVMPKENIQERGSSLFINPKHVQKCFSNYANILEHSVASKKPWFTPEEFPSNSQAFIVGKKI